jgi:hypothetical protein
MINDVTGIHMLGQVNFEKSRTVQTYYNRQYTLLIYISKMYVIYVEHLWFDSVLKLDDSCHSMGNDRSFCS